MGLTLKVTPLMLSDVLQTRVNPSDFEVDALGVITISRGCFERCGSNKKTPPIDSPYLF